jgi:hypothetical protein
MYTQRAVGVLSLATLCLLAAAPGRAALITYEASGTIGQADNASQLPSVLSAAAVGGTLSLDFTVDTSTIGNPSGPGAATFFSPLVSAQASIGSGSFGLSLDNNQIGIASDQSLGGAYLTQYSVSSSGNVAANFTGTTSTFSLLTAAFGAAPLNLYGDTSLSNAPLNASDANLLDLFQVSTSSYVDGILQSTSDVLVTSNVAVTSVTQAPEINPASAGSALTLLLGSLAVLRGRRALKIEQ